MKNLSYALLLALIISFISSCDNSADPLTRDMVDSLNELSCQMLYVSRNKSEELACKAISMSDNYKDGRMEALINLGNARTMIMDYDSAKVLYNEVISSTNNALYRFLADARMMKICQIMALNKEFYEFRTDAEKCIVRIKEDEDVMNEHEKLMWKVSNCLYNLCLTSHFSNLRYDEESEEAKKKYREWYKALDEDSTILAPMFARKDFMFWREYGNLYYESMCLVNIADSLSLENKNFEALDTLNSALECINRFYGFTEERDKLLMFDMMAMNSLSKEMKWINDPTMITIPEWMVAVREELSIVYGALGMKEASDYNHNVYFDILDATRQDMSLQERQDRLEQENRQLDFLLFALGLLVIIVVAIIVIGTYNVSKKSAKKSERLSKLLELCTKMTAAMPVHAIEREEIESAVHEAVDEDVKTLFPEINSDWTVFVSQKMDKFDREMLSVLQVLYRWIILNGQTIVQITEEREKVESARYVHAKRIDENKRQYVDKSTSVSIVNGITPFLDRALREVGKLQGVDIDMSKDEISQRLTYVKELVEKIEAYNDVLGHWVKIRQGTVTLNVENFPLQPLFDTLLKGKSMFDKNNIKLEIADSPAIVKADRALTLFMMNTLMDNARKYTPEGGKVSVCALEKDNYVEVSVEDTGNGLSEEDVQVLNNSKVYDSSKIGISNDVDGQISKNKGFGFGLMNCRGIIEKYRKTSALFGVCTFGVESHVGKGSRFFFRLPKGGMSKLMFILMILMPMNISAHEIDSCKNATETVELEKALQFYDSLYVSNLNHEYEKAIEYADSAIFHLNNHYLSANPNGKLLLQLDGNDMNEITLFKLGFNTSYSDILNIRNEVSIAALSLNRRHLYRYNSEIFTRLYKLLSDDRSLEDYCNSVQKSSINKRVTLILAALLFLFLILTYAMLYYRHNLLYIFNMRQFLQFVHNLYTAKDDDLKMCLYRGVNEVRMVEAIGVAMIDVDTDKRLRFSFDGNTEAAGILEQYMKMCYERQEKVTNVRARILAYPLVVSIDEERLCVGVLGLILHDANISKNDDISLQLIAEFFAMHSYFNSTRVDEQKAELEMKMDEMRRTEQEDSRIHIQNMVLDNYLSTIKHETMYYPGRIRQIAELAIKDPTVESLKDLDEITNYYKDVFTLLSYGAARQLERRVFKRERVMVTDLVKYAKRSFDKRNKKLMLPIRLDINEFDQDLFIVTDHIIANYMIDTLMNASFEDTTSGVLTISFAKSDKFVKFAFSDSRQEYSEEEIANLFYADSIRYDNVTGVLHGQHFLLLKQMVREHDEYSGHKGCRIYVQSIPNNGMVLNMEL
ncbi:MAG: DUF5113 domain-containing protein [Bacteroidaceae bacterium]|nr:DUF5113 domain-containing protein [Bacteroidaceae bacterium]